jgi:YD repeat-containing protein
VIEEKELSTGEISRSQGEVNQGKKDEKPKSSDRVLLIAAVIAAIATIVSTVGPKLIDLSSQTNNKISSTETFCSELKAESYLDCTFSLGLQQAMQKAMAKIVSDDDLSHEEKQRKLNELKQLIKSTTTHSEETSEPIRVPNSNIDEKSSHKYTDTQSPSNDEEPVRPSQNSELSKEAHPISFFEETESFFDSQGKVLSVATRKEKNYPIGSDFEIASSKGGQTSPDYFTSTTRDAIPSPVYTYDAAGRITSIYYASTQKYMGYFYGEGDQLLEVREGESLDSLRLMTRYTYDAAGRVASIYDGPAQKYISYVYSEDDLVLEIREGESIDSLELVSRQTYDDFGRVIKRTEFENNIHSHFAYDQYGNLVALKKDNSEIDLDWVSSVDGDWRIYRVTVTDNNGVSKTTDLKLDGNILNRSLDKPTAAITTEYFYDGSLRDIELLDSSYGEIKNSYSNWSSSFSSYKNDGIKNHYLYDLDSGSLLASYDGHTKIDYFYDSYGRRSGIISSDGSRIRYEYDGLGNMARMVLLQEQKMTKPIYYEFTQNRSNGILSYKSDLKSVWSSESSVCSKLLLHDGVCERQVISPSMPVKSHLVAEMLKDPLFELAIENTDVKVRKYLELIENPKKTSRNYIMDGITKHNSTSKDKNPLYIFLLYFCITLFGSFLFNIFRKFFLSMPIRLLRRGGSVSNGFKLPV